MPVQHRVGSLWLLTVMPWWLLIVTLVMGTSGIIYLIRLTWEGWVPDKSRASMPGDMFLAVYCGIIAWICQQKITQGWLTNIYWHRGIAALCVLAGLMAMYSGMTQSAASRRWTLRPANIYHNLIVIPLFAYIIVSMAPILWAPGHTFPKIGALACLLVWVGLLIWDIQHDNLVQIKEDH